MKYDLGEMFYEDENYSDRAKFCNENGFKIKEIEKDEEGKRRFQICEIPALTEEEILTELRTRRERECFSVVNRGQLWYATLSDEQKEELATWYREWLDVTEKYADAITIDEIIPTRPVWLK